MRSRAGSQILEGLGFKEVYNLKGGIKAWHGERAEGPEIKGLEIFAQVKGLKEAAELAYLLEDGLEAIYETLKKKANSEELRSYLERLANYEVQHKKRIEEFFSQKMGESLVVEPQSSGIIEGGFLIKEIMEGLEQSLDSPQGILDAALMFEAQAMDLYFRLSKRATDPEIEKFYAWLQDEERGHILFVSYLLEKY